MSDATFDWLFSLGQFGIKFGLENMRALVAGLGHPERAFPSLHITGTNGKGSVTALSERALRQSGRRTGRYTSPHLLDLTERIAIDGQPVAHDDLRAAVDRVRRLVERLRGDGVLEVHPTFFEVTTAAAFDLFRAHRVEVAVCEVGLGGRLDATNVLTPVACAITSIGFDHQQYLGHTLGAIATEKAGIIKPGVPVVVGPVAEEAWIPIAARAADVGAPLQRAFDDVELGAVVEEGTDGRQRFTLRTARHDYGEVGLALAGRHQVDNAVVAVRLLELLDGTELAVSPADVTAGLARVRWPGRLDTVTLPDGRSVLLDAAHNLAGAEALARHLRAQSPRPLVMAAMRDKDVGPMVEALSPVVSRIVATRASNPRSLEPDELAAIVARVAPALPVRTADSPADALRDAWGTGPAVVVAGSIFLLADVMSELRRS